MAINATTQPDTAAQFLILPGYKPMSVLWKGEHAPYSNEYAARWQVKRLYQKLVKAEAIAKPSRELLVHPARYSEVVENDAFQRLERHAEAC